MEKIDTNLAKKWLKLGLIFAIVIGVGMFALNQTLAYYYKAKFLLQPCQLCEEINKGIKCSPSFENNFKMNLTGEFIMPKP